MTPTESTEEFTAVALRDIWHFLVHSERLQGFKELSRPEAENLFLGLSHRDQAEILLALPPAERRSWMRLLPPDDAADLAQVAPPAEREGLLALLDEPTRNEVNALLAYAEDRAGARRN